MQSEAYAKTPQVKKIYVRFGRETFLAKRAREGTREREERKTSEGSLFVDCKKYDNLCSTERENIIHYSKAFSKNLHYR